MRIDLVSVLPELFDAFLSVGVCGRAVVDGKVLVHCHNPRDYASLPHRIVDDRPYGGGSGMVMMPAPILAALRTAQQQNPNATRIYLTPRGERFSDEMARTLAADPGLIFLCGRYRGVDERAVAAFGGREISVGDYILSGGEVAAMVVMDAVLRQIEGVLGNEASVNEETFAGDGLLDAPCYTRPPVFEGASVPEVLLSGNHAEIARWQQETAKQLTEKKRPDLLKCRRYET